MEFRKCFIGGRSYGFGTTEIGAAAAARGARLGGLDDPSYAEAERAASADSAQFHRDPRLAFSDTRLLETYRGGGEGARAIRDFMRVLSVGHTVVPEGDGADPSQMQYQAESPDEGALTGFARAMGWFLCGRTSAGVTVRVMGTDERFAVLNVNKFNSARKRMSVVCRTPEGDIMLYCKGADNVMLERLRGGPAGQADMSAQLGAYATEGLRTLVLATRHLSEEEWREWDAVHKAAGTSLEDREGALERAAELIEKDMVPAGATAIEDKLQVGVPDAIATLARAGLKIWVLTGDKQETAENIGFACQLLRDDMRLIYVNAPEPDAVSQQLDEALRSVLAAPASSPATGCEASGPVALIVDGKALTAVAAAKLQPKLLELARRCEAVVACRVSPGQKREVVAMVRAGVRPEPMTLAIGDGANDVPMITEAHVGVGISGNEGMQAVRSADYAIAQFRYLKRLMLVHGRNNYRRVAVVILYSLYKQMAFVTSLFLFNIVNGWSGTAIYDSWIMVGFNALYTFLPPIIYGFMEQDVRAETAMSVPQLYGAGQRNENFNGLQLGAWLGNGLIHCALVFGLPFGVAAASPDMDLGVLGTVVMWALSLVANLRVVLEEHRISVVSHAAVLLSVLVFYLWALLLNVAWALTGNFDTYYGVAMVSFGSGRAWLMVALTVVAMTGLDVAFKYMARTWRPDAAVIVQERERAGQLLPRSTRDMEACTPPSPSAATPSPCRGSALSRVVALASPKQAEPEELTLLSTPRSA